MLSAAAFADILTSQKGLSIVASFLQLTAYLYGPQPRLPDETSVDYIVVGGGSAGAVIANRLTEDSKTTVLLIEIGGYPPIASELPGLPLYLKNSRYDWNFTAQNTNYNVFRKDFSLLPQGRVLGGSSSINYMNYIRGAPVDYDAWANHVGDDSWKYTNLLKFFKKSERYCNIDGLSQANRKYHGTEGYMGVRKLHSYNATHTYFKGLREYGIDITEDVNGKDVLGYTLPMVTIAKGIRQSTARSFLSKKFQRRRNLIIYKDTRVTKILFDDNKNAIGVEAVHNSDILTFYAKKEVIISAGPFNSPHLLMLSGIGPKQHLSDMNINCISDLPVGLGLQDHTSMAITFNMGNLIYPKGPYNPHKFVTPMFYGAISLDSEGKTPDYVTYNYLANSELFLKHCVFSLGYTDEICDNLYEKAKTGGEILLSVISLVHPKSRGSVTLNSNDPFDKPLIHLGRFAENEDLENFVKYIEHYLGATNTNTFKETQGSLVYLDLPECDAEHGSTEYWRCYALAMANSFYTYAGTCAMGTVVDSNLLVRGVKRLRVADQSIIPIITSGTMNIPAIMIGEKCAHIIKGGKEDNNDDDDHHHDNDNDDNEGDDNDDNDDNNNNDDGDDNDDDGNNDN